jgi:hypothetical protein
MKNKKGCEQKHSTHNISGTAVIAVHAFFNFISLENTAQIVHAPYYAAGI